MTSKRIPLSLFDNSKLTIEKYDDDKKTCELLYDGEKNVIFTTNDVRVQRTWNTTSGNMTVSFTEEVDIFGISRLDDSVINLISQYAMEFFNKEMTVEDLDEFLYIKSLNMKNGSPNFRFHVDTDSIVIYDKQRNIMNNSVEVLQRTDNRYKLALSLPVLFFESNRAFLKWSSVQILLCSRYKDEIPFFLVDDDTVNT